jgi:hypothetical protein
MIVSICLQAIHAPRTVLSLVTRSTKSSNSTLPSYAIFANVRVLLPGTYAGHPGAGDFVGSLTKFAMTVWSVCESVTSFGVAVVLLKVPKISGTIERGMLDGPSEPRVIGKSTHVLRYATRQLLGMAGYRRIPPLQ